MNWKNRAIALLCLPLLVVAVGLAGCSEGRRSPSAAAPEAVGDVSIFVVQKKTVPDWLEAVGTVRAEQTSQLASQMMGNIIEIRVREGDRVQRGQVLAVIDDTQPRAALEQAIAAQAAAQKEVTAADSAAALAEATLKRYQQLYERKSVSPQEFDEIRTRYQLAEARRDMARAGQSQADAALVRARTSLDYSRIRAPFAGVMTAKMADAGTLASPGMALFTIEDTSRYRLEAAVDETDIPHVRIGQAVPVSIDALGSAELSGKVVQIVPAADPASRSFLAKVQLPEDGRLRSGLFGRARFARGERSALVIPRTCIVERGQLLAVYVIDAQQKASLRYVTLGKTAGEQVEVLSGLQDGEKLVAGAGDRELGGKRIRVGQ